MLSADRTIYAGGPLFVHKKVFGLIKTWGGPPPGRKILRGGPPPNIRGFFSPKIPRPLKNFSWRKKTPL